ncbi:HAMP domain-containing histidine kinase [Listeria booriae]|uniref:two component system sensor histidine kinase PieS n=1 Tax=Listeria booriae TaxID=1552123 RepID=UPI0016235745|nr:two component system sensor histidine kinase PieS [Listeria booriae]MBC1573176.1 HAMP domain-containing histidine kinase [Listeria booriae]
MSRMKFKYFYQLFLTQFIILFIACLMIGLLISHFMKDYLYQSEVADLTAYGEEIAKDVQGMSSEEVASPILRTYQQILSVKNIHYVIFDDTAAIIYPKNDRPLPPDFRLKTDEWKELQDGKTVSTLMDTRFSEQLTRVSIPIEKNGEFAGGIMLTSPISGTEKVIGKINWYVFYTILISITIALILSAIIAKLQVNRFRKLSSATKEVIKGNYSVRLKESSIDEIGALAGDFNKMTQTLEESAIEIERQEKRRRQFIADVSHEMRTPLTTISGLTEGLVNDIIPKSETDRCIALIDTEARRLARLVNENLDYERIRSNQIQLNKTTFTAHEFLDIIKDQLQLTAEDKGNQIIVDAPDSVQIFADYDRLMQVFINIVKNSIQFTENGTITLTAKQEYKATIFEISDTGIGMDESEVEQIWDRFYKADMSRTSTKFGESGIGLSIVKQLISYHDGEVSVHSAPNEGTTFTISLPFFTDKEL